MTYLLRPCRPLKTEEFTDLCSVTNISVLMFDHYYRGYYIHGKSPSGYTEITTENLRKQLVFESQGRSQIRGITADDPDLQTYIILVPPQLVNKYKIEYQTNVAKLIAA